MAENETSVSGDVVWQDGDDLSETNLTRTAAKSNLTDYVERGMGFAVDHAADTVDIGSGHVIIQDGVDAYDLFPNQQTDISLPNTSAVNYVYVAHQPGTDDDVYYHIDDDDTAPADPSLKIGTIDTANDTADDTINRNPDADFGDTTHDSVSTEQPPYTEGREPSHIVWRDDGGTFHTSSKTAELGTDSDVGAAVQRAIDDLETAGNDGHILVATGDYTPMTTISWDSTDMISVDWQGSTLEAPADNHTFFEYLSGSNGHGTTFAEAASDFHIRNSGGYADVTMAYLNECSGEMFKQFSARDIHWVLDVHASAQIDTLTVREMFTDHVTTAVRVRGSQPLYHLRLVDGHLGIADSADAEEATAQAFDVTGKALDTMMTNGYIDLRGDGNRCFKVDGGRLDLRGDAWVAGRTSPSDKYVAEALNSAVLNNIDFTFWQVNDFTSIFNNPSGEEIVGFERVDTNNLSDGRELVRGPNQNLFYQVVGPDGNKEFAMGSVNDAPRIFSYGNGPVWLYDDVNDNVEDLVLGSLDVRNQSVSSGTADHTTAADAVMTIDAGDGNTYEIPLRLA